MANERRFDCNLCIHMNVCPAYEATQAKCEDYIPQGNVIPVIRCENCEYYDGHICEFFSKWPDQYNTGHTVYMEPDDFCSYGEKSGAIKIHFPKVHKI